MATLCKPELLARQLTLLLRRDVELVRLASAAPAQLVIAAQYQGAGGELVGQCLADLALAASAGAALSMIPADVAQESIRKRALEENLRENFAEVLNVLSLLFTGDGARATLAGMSFPPEVPQAAMAGQSTLFEVEIDGYGKGLLGVRWAP